MGFNIKTERREVFGKNAARRMRKEDKLPVILYGPAIGNVPLILEKKDLFVILKSESGENTIFKVTFDSETANAMLKDIQRDPVTDEILHADLIQIALDKTIQVSVPVVPVGEAVGVKTEGGFVDLATREIEVECLPQNIPDQIEVDISSLHINQSLQAEDIVLPEGVKILEDPKTVIVVIQIPMAEEEVEEAEEEEIIEEEMEPEVITREKEKKEEEKEEEEEEKKEE
ncbi:MAG: 50S ribosomal protein L25 [Candidatus Aminicenantes bacterium]